MKSRLQPGNLLLSVFVGNDPPIREKTVCRLCKKPILAEQAATWRDIEPRGYVHTTCEVARSLAALRRQIRLKESPDE